MDWNWITIPLTIVLSFGVLWGLLIWWENKGKYGAPECCFGVLGLSSFFGAISVIMLLLVLPNIEQHNGNVTVSKKVDIISLENVNSTTGQVYGSAFGFVGSSDGSVMCKFVTEEPDGIRVITDNTDRVVFHEITEGNPRAEKPIGVIYTLID